MKIFEKAIQSHKENLPFVLYRKPNENNISGFFMNNDSLLYTNSFSESGFVFAPFKSDKKAILFPLENSEIVSEQLQLRDIMTTDKKMFSFHEKAKERYVLLVEKTIEAINKSDLKKVVVSRKEEVQLSSFDLFLVYEKLLQNYKSAFVYVWFHPKVGLWFGATPETLLHIKNLSFKTMSLAGTQVYDTTKEVVWKSKEIEEQQLVTDFIESQLEGISSNLKIDKTETVKAGSLLHLRTKVEGFLNESSDLKSLIRALHPTPAVCGMPRKAANRFILENENYDRSFYTGFLGELNLKESGVSTQTSHLYVNLRCMKIDENIVSIYVGGGITKGSSAEREWEETVSKTGTMKRVL